MNHTLIFNNVKKGKKVLATLENELANCQYFLMSVAFITSGGITPLLETFKNMEEKGIKGRILTSDYLFFSEPKALEKLNSFENIELKMYRCDSDDGFHTKGYLFAHEDELHILVGSSNLTQNALTVNKEWNTFVYSNNDDEYADDVFKEFDYLWELDNSIPYDKIMDIYRKKYEEIDNRKRKMIEYNDIEINRQFIPNTMQMALINNFSKSLRRGDKRGLLISATGTGKTYASAFAIKKMKPKHILFIAHREQIIKKALQSYKNVFGNDHIYGILSGNHKDLKSDFLFSTMQSMAKNEILNKFEKNYFDIIVIDEVHRAGASSYQKIMNYFEPKYFFGMSASPERNDNFDIYSLFDHNILYEIRLEQALEENLLCPFHYFGISDINIDGDTPYDNGDKINFSNLICDERVEHIINTANYYGYSGNRVKGLIFCSRQDEARELSIKLNKKGLRTVALFGSDNLEYREECIDKLTSDNREDCLDYIIAIDIFNEGIDIPELNQIIMLRPTESAIIFVQQMGRGLRKYKDKEFVVIIDFIANYRNNFLIPLALSGDRSYNKDSIRRFIQEGAKSIPGSSTIHFDEISKKRIFESIDYANFNDIKIIKDSYLNLKNKLGRIPSLFEFDYYGSIDPLRIFDNKSLGSYHNFLSKYEKDLYKIRFSNNQKQVLEFISRKFASGKRPHELVALSYLLDNEHDLFSYLKEELKDRYSFDVTSKTVDNIVNIFTNSFQTGSSKKTYQDCILIQKEGNDYGISVTFKNMLKDQEFKRQIREIVDFGLYRNHLEYSKPYDDTSFNLYKKYTYEDVCRLLEWDKGEVALNIGGYKYDRKTNTYPVFINYDKSDDIADSIKYRDILKSRDTIIAISKSGRTIASDDVQTALKSKELNIEMDLFIRKNKDDKISKEFYYMGKIVPTGRCKEFKMANTSKMAVEIEYKLNTAIDEDLYDYIIN